MGVDPHVLFTYLASDLSPCLSTWDFNSLFEPKVRDRLPPDATVRQVAAVSLLDSILKKFGTLSEKANDAALAKFLDCNDRCKSFSQIDETNLSEIEAVAVGEVRKFLWDFWYTSTGDLWLCSDCITHRMDVGPGSSVGVKGTSHYEKLAAGPLTGTRKSLFALFQREVSRYPLTEETEKIRSKVLGGFVQVKGSRLSYVAKSNAISRTICTEPLLNMLMQKGIGNLFEHHLETKLGINLSKQPDKNRALALIGSRSGKFGTIDLSSASDTISMSLLGKLLPPYVLGWLAELRSPYVTLPNGEEVSLHMVSSMGNAFTFPLQTILFSSIVVGVYRALGIRLEKPQPNGDRLGNFAVFGDDIIVCREAYDLTCQILKRFGFLVNAEKSFNYGPFRESCGADYWHGTNVRGIYCDALTTKQDVLSLINRLNMWSANHCISLERTIQYLLRWSGDFQPVPPWEADTAGLKVPLWYAFDTTIGKPKTKRLTSRLGSIVYKRYLPTVEKFSFLCIEDYVKIKGRWLFQNAGVVHHIKIDGRWKVHNPPGVLLSAVQGRLRDGMLISRQKRDTPVLYKKRLAVAPNWDYYDPCLVNLTPDGWRRYFFFVGLNLGRV